MLEIPLAKDTDVEDVVWGLQTAETLWKRGERIDALVWLRRAAQAAGDANDDDRALELARHAAELTEWMANAAAEEGADEDTHVVIALRADDDEPVESTIEIEAADVDLASVPPPRPPPPAPSPRATAPSHVAEEPHAEVSATRALASAPSPTADDEPERPSRASVPPAEKVHAGMFDPWADQAAQNAAPPKPPPPPPPVLPVFDAPLIGEDGEEEVVTSVRSHAPLASSEPPASTRLPVAQPVVPQQRSAPPLKPPPPLPPRARAATMKPAAAPPPPAPAATPPPTPAADAPAATDAPAPAPAATDAPAPAPAAIAATETPAAPALVLDEVEAFADLPDDARTAFASAATLHSLAEGEEIGAFALAYVVSGSFDVAATVVDAAAVRLTTGAVLRSHGTTEEGIPMRLIAVSGPGIVATWSDESVDAAFRTCPWVEEDLCAAADRVQTLVGITIGPLGERLDMSIRELIVARLTMRPLTPSEIVVRRGEPVPGLLLVGIGELELVRDDDRVTGTVGSGEFLFPKEVLNAGSAPATARAGPGGALVMFGDRGIAQELLVTCPPLLEVFAGM